MKSYDELTNNLLERRDNYVAEKKKKRKIVISATTSLCLAALIGVGAWQGGMFEATPPEQTVEDALYPGIKDYFDESKGESPDNTDASNSDISNDNPSQENQGGQISNPQGNSQTVETDDPIRTMFIINRVNGKVGGAKLNFDTSEYYSEKKNLTDMSEYFGRDFSTLNNLMPDGFQFVGKHETKFFYKNDGTLAFDSCHYLYSKGEQEITIHASKIGVPYDYMYVMDNPSPSNINGVEITMGGIYSEEKPEEFDLVFADFSHKGIQYRITVENVPDDGKKNCFLWLYGIVTELTKA